MAANISEIAQGLAIACLNQESFVKELVAVSKEQKPAVAKDAKLLGEAVGEFYQAIRKAVRVAPES